MANGIQITLIGKPGCHLCDDARTQLASVVSSFAAARPDVSIDVIERNILEDAELAAKHSEEIPVILVNGKMHGYWHVDAARLSAKLEEVANA
jgi:glutaredoxin